MIEQRLLKLNHYFDEQIWLCGQRNKDLLADDRIDEAVFEKIKENVYDIFRTIVSVAAKTCKNDPEGIKQFFILKAQQIPANWATAYEKAKQNHDIIKMQTEKIKLDTIDEIQEKFISVWEEDE